NYLYWLNSVEISAIYPLGNKKGVEVGVGYGWTRIEKYSGIYYKFRLIPIWIGYSQKNLILRGAYVYSCSPGFYYRGGYKVSAVFRLNRVLGIGLNFGGVWYTGKTTGDWIYLSLNGVSLSIGYNFQLKGGVK
ncbi:MAG: hypothetical protein GWP03_02065, partial [Proteobacteria bacterium]|nr:hypothetical protein [Pseudomonadota bacterium]